MKAPVLDVGGTHVTAALVDTCGWRTVEGSRQRRPLRSDGSADETIASLAAALRSLGDTSAAALGISMPGPFDYDTGIGRFQGVGKFDALNGVDVGSALRAALPAPPARIAFVNDASAFTIGEWVGGPAAGVQRVAGITLGTGVGSAFLDRGHVVSAGPEVPPNGHAYLLRIHGQPLEDFVSRRAIVAAYQSATAGQSRAARPPLLDVDAIARRAADADPVARSVLERAIGVLGGALRPWLVRFNAGILVVGGGITGSWELIEPVLSHSLCDGGCRSEPRWHGVIVHSADPEESILAGAAWHTANSQTETSLRRDT